MKIRAGYTLDKILGKRIKEEVIFKSCFFPFLFFFPVKNHQIKDKKSNVIALSYIKRSVR